MENQQNAFKEDEKDSVSISLNPGLNAIEPQNNLNVEDNQIEAEIPFEDILDAIQSNPLLQQSHDYEIDPSIIDNLHNSCQKRDFKLHPKLFISDEFNEKPEKNEDELVIKSKPKTNNKDKNILFDLFKDCYSKDGEEVINECPHCNWKITPICPISLRMAHIDACSESREKGKIQKEELKVILQAHCENDEKHFYCPYCFFPFNKKTIADHVDNCPENPENI